MKWSVIYKRAVLDDGTFFFPERLTKEFLENARRTMGTFLFANQYQNEVLPIGSQPFKKDWLKVYQSIPEKCNTFISIDPAISQNENADFTAMTVVDVDKEKNWYLKFARRARLTPTQIVDWIFKANDVFKPNLIAIETVAYQEALLYMIEESSRKRKKIVPVTGIKHGPDKNKEMRIMALIPRFEWGWIYVAEGMHDFELEYTTFPRGAHDDILDALASIEEIVYYPEQERKPLNDPSPNDPGYESWYIKQLIKKANTSDGYGD